MTMAAPALPSAVSGTATTARSSMASLLGSVTSSSSLAMASSNVTLAGAKPGPEDGGSGECELLGSFSLLVQSALGILALSSLVWKRWRERPQRPLKIWAFDASKQVVGSMLLHVANLFMSMLSAGNLSVKLQVSEKDPEEYRPNPCSFYLLNLAIDVRPSMTSPISPCPYLALIRP